MERKKEQFRTNERKQIASALYKVAERLENISEQNISNACL